jgi:hypothetical protein
MVVSRWVVITQSSISREVERIWISKGFHGNAACCAEAIETEGRNSPSIAKGLPQPSEGSFDEVEPEGYASSRAGFST